MRILAMDPGTRRIGLAVCDEGELLASPVATVVRESEAQAIAAVVEALRETGAERLIVGLPLRTDGREGPAARRARALGDAVGEAASVEVEYVDERFTTVIAERALGEAGVRGKKRRDLVDRAAAVVLLQGYIDGRRHSTAGVGDPEP